MATAATTMARGHGGASRDSRPRRAAGEMRYHHGGEGDGDGDRDGDSDGGEQQPGGVDVDGDVDGDGEAAQQPGGV